MRYLHTMLRVRDLDAALDFFCTKLGLVELRRRDSERGRFTLVFLGSGAEGDAAMVELTHNWDESEPYETGRYFGHLAYAVDDIYALFVEVRELRLARAVARNHQTNPPHAPSDRRGASCGPGPTRGRCDGICVDHDCCLA